MTTHSVTINGIDLVYDKEGSGPPIVFLHGSNASAVYWEGIVPHFMGDYTCYVLEQRGHGRSGRSTEEDYGAEAFVGDCTAFLEKVTGPAILVGQSMGGLVAFGAGAARPDLVRGIYSEDAIPQSNIAGSEGDVAHIIALLGAIGSIARERQTEGFSVAQYAHRIGQLTTFGPRIADLWPPQALILFARFSYNADPALYNEVVADWTREQATEICQRLRCPVHLALGDVALGGIVTPTALEDFAATGVSFTSTEFAGAGHMISPAFGRAYINDLKAFLAKVPA
jgi:pimeloyl-ACP methyl ester carboxylesterase